MTAKNQDFTMNAGESKLIDVDATTDDDSSGDLDISGFQTLEWSMYESKGGAQLVSKDDSGSDVTVTDASVGAYEVTIQPTDTETNTDSLKEEFYHRVRLTDSGGRNSDLLEGTITVYDV